MATIFTPKYFFNCACRDFGLEDDHTIAIARVKELHDQGHYNLDEASFACKAIYAHGLHCHEADEDEDFPDEVDEAGFDPYEGGYTWDC